MVELFLDTETTNIIPKNTHPSKFEKYPRLVSIAWILRDEINVYSQHYCIVKNETEDTEIGASFIHHIDRQMVDKFGKPLELILEMFMKDLGICERIVAHNIDFDVKMVASELFRLGKDYDGERLLLSDYFCTMKNSTEIVRIPSKFGNNSFFKWPKLVELHTYLFCEGFSGQQHNALDDTNALVKCYYKLQEKLLN